MFWKKKLSVLVLGSDGMLGTELFDALKAETLDPESHIGYVYGMGRPEIDAFRMTERHALGDFIRTHRKFDVCVNCIAMTDTYAAENTEEGERCSYMLNALLPGFLAESCAYWGMRLIHVSTDYVFGGEPGKRDRPYCVEDTAWPKNVYGRHKLLGEETLKARFAGKTGRYAILRTSWLYGKANSKSFVHKFVFNAVRAAKSGATHIEVTENETSVPTSAEFLSKVIVEEFVKRNTSGVFHAVPRGPAVTRADWAKDILAQLKQYVTAEDAVFEKVFGQDFIQPVCRNGMLNPEMSALACSEFSSPGLSAPAGEWLKRFIKENGFGIYEEAVRRCSN